MSFYQPLPPYGNPSIPFRFNEDRVHISAQKDRPHKIHVIIDTPLAVDEYGLAIMAFRSYKRRMEKMTSIYVDMDDVLTQSHRTFIDVLAREFGKKVTYSQITNFDLQQSFGLTAEEYAVFFERVHEPEEIIRHLPVPGAKEAMTNWRHKGYRISIMTGRPSETREVSMAWLDLHGFAYDSFTIVNKYGRETSNGDRSISLEDLATHEFDLAIEDSGQMARFLSAHMNVRVALLNRPWNQGVPFDRKVKRCANWEEIGVLFETL